MRYCKQVLRKGFVEFFYSLITPKTLISTYEILFEHTTQIKQQAIEHIEKCNFAG